MDSKDNKNPDQADKSTKKTKYRRSSFDKEVGLPSIEEIDAESKLRLEKAAAEFARVLNEMESASSLDCSSSVASHAASSNTESSSLGILSMGNLTDFSEYENESAVEVMRKEKTNISERISQSAMDTPFSKFLRGSSHIPSEESSVSSLGAPFDEHSSFDAEKFYANHTKDEHKSPESTSTMLCESEVEFNHDQITARSSSIVGSSSGDGTYIMASSAQGSDKDSPTTGNAENNSLFSDAGTWDSDLVYQRSFRRLASTAGSGNAENITDDQFFSNEFALQMLKEDEEKFKKEHMFEVGVNDLKETLVADFTFRDARDAIEPPSWLSAAGDCSNPVLQLSVGQWFGTKSEALGTLGEDSEAMRPNFGTSPETPQSDRVLHNTFSNGQTAHSVCLSPSNYETSELSSTSRADESSVLNLDSISRLIREISMNEISTATAKIIMSKNKSRRKRCLSKSKRHSTLIKSVEQAEESSTDESDNTMEASEESDNSAEPAPKPKPKHVPVSESTFNSSNQIPSIVEVVPVNASQAASNQRHSVGSDLSGAPVNHSSNRKSRRLKHGPEPKKVYRSAGHLSSKCDQGQKQGMMNNSNELGEGKHTLSCHAPSDSESSGSSRVLTSSLCSNHASQCCQHGHCTGCHSSNSGPRLTFSRSNSSPNLPSLHTPNTWLEPNNSTACCTYAGQHPNATGFNLVHPLPSEFMNHIPNYNLAPYLPYMNRPMCNAYGVPAISGTAETGVQGPNEFRFPRTYIGCSQKSVLTQFNSTGAALFYHLELVSPTSEKLATADSYGLSLKENIVYSAGWGPVNIEMFYTPKCEGEREVELRMFPSKSAEPVLYPSGVPKIVKIFLHSERPQVSLTNKKGVDKLEFPAVNEKSSISDIIVLENKGESPIALMVTIDECPNQSHSFEFSANPSDISASNRCSIFLPKVIHCLLSGSNTTGSRLDIPIFFKAGSCASASKTDEVKACISVKCADSGWPVLSTVFHMSAAVGAINLKLKEPVPNKLLVLKSKPYETDSRILVLVNKGSIPVDVDLAINPQCDSLFVLPPTVTVHPKKGTAITVYFQPSSPDNANGKLQAAAHSQDLVFDIVKVRGKIIGSSLETKQPKNLPMSHTKDPVNLLSFNLECSKKYLGWGGANIDKAVMKTITLRNPTEEEFRANAVIGEECQTFSIFTEEGGNTVSTLEFSVSPKSYKNLTLVFKPTQKKWYSSRLVFLPPHSRHCHFIIPLTGYGGASNVKIVNLMEQGDTNYKLCFSSLSDNGGCLSNIVLRNMGHREAFVKFHGDDSHGLNLSISPSEFILFEQEQRTVSVSCIPGMELPHQTQGKILMYWGDEIMRQRLRRCELREVTPPRSGPLRYINFGVPFLGEENVQHDNSSYYGCNKKDVKMFNSLLHEITISVVIPSENGSLCQTASFSTLSLVQESPVCIPNNYSTSTLARDMSPPHRDSSCSKKTSPPLLDVEMPCGAKHSLPEIKVDEWLSAETSTGVRSDALSVDVFSVAPKDLKLDAVNRIGRVVINNHANEEIEYKVTWVGSNIAVSPCQGSIRAKSKNEISVQYLSSDGKKHQENTECIITITSCGMEKHVSVYADDIRTSQNHGETDKIFASIESLVNQCKETARLKATARSKSVSLEGLPAPNVPTRHSLGSDKTSSDIEDTKSSGETKLPKKKSGSFHSGASRKTSSSLFARVAVEPRKVVFPSTKPREQKSSFFEIKNWTSEKCDVNIVKPESPFVVKSLSFAVRPNKFIKVPVHFSPDAPGSYQHTLCVKLDTGKEMNVSLLGKCIP